jgi:hypothetical protein
MAIAVAIEAAAIFTTVFPIRIVVRRCSGDSFSATTACDPTRFSLSSVLTFARVIDMRATSELEKKAERMTQIIKRKISRAFSIIVFHNVLVHADDFD